jgi:hypothetical protein
MLERLFAALNRVELPLSICVVILLILFINIILKKKRKTEGKKKHLLLFFVLFSNSGLVSFERSSCMG